MPDFRIIAQPEISLPIGIDPDAGENMGQPTVWVHLSCGLAVGKPRWQTSDIYEADECDYEARVRVDKASFEEGCASAHCPKCGQDLPQEDGHMELA
jgi:hypothetical protein